MANAGIEIYTVNDELKLANVLGYDEPKLANVLISDNALLYDESKVTNFLHSDNACSSSVSCSNNIHNSHIVSSSASSRCPIDSCVPPPRPFQSGDFKSGKHE